MNNSQLTAMKIRGMKIVITLEKGQFPENGGTNTKTIYSASLPGFLDAECVIQQIPAFLYSMITTIYGMTNTDIFAATKFNVNIGTPAYNQVEVYAGYVIGVTPNLDGTYNQLDITAAIDLLGISYVGQILSAGADLNNPNKPFVITSLVASEALQQVMQPISINSTTTLSSAISSIITTYNATSPQITYVLSGIFPDTKINNAHYIGTFGNQLQQICDAYGYNFRILLTSNPNQSQVQLTQIGTAPPNSVPDIISSATGMIGYPTILPYGISVREFYNPSRNINDQIQLQTYYTPLSNIYYVWQILTTLQVREGGAWDNALMLYGSQNPGQIT